MYSLRTFTLFAADQPDPNRSSVLCTEWWLTDPLMSLDPQSPKDYMLLCSLSHFIAYATELNLGILRLIWNFIVNFNWATQLTLQIYLLYIDPFAYYCSVHCSVRVYAVTFRFEVISCAN